MDGAGGLDANRNSCDQYCASGGSTISEKVADRRENSSAIIYCLRRGWKSGSKDGTGLSLVAWEPEGGGGNVPKCERVAINRRLTSCSWIANGLQESWGIGEAHVVVQSRLNCRALWCVSCSSVCGGLQYSRETHFRRKMMHMSARLRPFRIVRMDIHQFFYALNIRVGAARSSSL